MMFTQCNFSSDIENFSAGIDVLAKMAFVRNLYLCRTTQGSAVNVQLRALKMRAALFIE